MVTKKPVNQSAGDPAPRSENLLAMADAMQQSADESMEEFRRTNDSYFFNQAGMEENLARQLRDNAKNARIGETRVAAASEESREWQLKADALWMANSRLSISGVAKIIAKQSGVTASWDWIRKRIKKSGT